jgi:hypothetical protein
MPLVRIDLVRGKSAHYRKVLGEIIYKAMVDVSTCLRTTNSRSSPNMRLKN